KKLIKMADPQKFSRLRSDNEPDDCTDCSASNGCKAASKVRAEKIARRNRHEDHVARLAPKYRLRPGPVNRRALVHRLPGPLQRPDAAEPVVHRRRHPILPAGT